MNYLVWIELVGILPKLFGEVISPPEVCEELRAVDAPSIVRAWANDLPSWIDVRTPDVGLRDDPRWRSLDLGERAALALATELQPSILLIDERAGSDIARGLGLAVTGMLGVLDEAAGRKLISLPDANRSFEANLLPLTRKQSSRACLKR